MIAKMIRGALLAGALLGMLPAGEAAILQDLGNGGITLGLGGFIAGQSFIADASVAELGSIEFYYLHVNTALPAAAPLMELLLGDGLDGPVLGSFQFDLAENEPTGFKSADFTGILLNPGQAYTFRLTQATAAEGGITHYSHDAYAGGVHYDSILGALPYDDLTFRINGTGDEAAVPEPSTGLLLGLALVAAGLIRRRPSKPEERPLVRKLARGFLHGYCRVPLLGAALLSFLPATGRAAIIQDTSNGSLGWAFGGAAFGQSFTANASVAQLSSIEIYYISTMTDRPAAAPAIDLIGGAGYGGPILDSFQFVFAENELPGYKLADFSGNILTPGLIYTFRISQAVNAEGGVSGSSLNPYAGGSHYDSGGNVIPGTDLRFRINGGGDEAAVPEPSTVVLFGLGAGLVLAGRKLTAFARKRKPSVAWFSRAAAVVALASGLSPLLPGAVISSQNVDGANTVGPFSFGQSVTTPGGGPWSNIQFNFAITESGELFDPAGGGAFGTLFLLSQSYAGTADALDAATPGFLASTSTIISGGGSWQFGPGVILEPLTQYFFYMGSVLGPTQVLWSNINNPLAGDSAFLAFAGLNYAASPAIDSVFVLRGDVADVPEPGSIALAAAGLAMCAMGTQRKPQRRNR